MQQEKHTTLANSEAKRKGRTKLQRDGKKCTNVRLLLDYGLVHAARFRALLRQCCWVGRPLTWTHSRVALVKPAALLVRRSREVWRLATTFIAGLLYLRLALSISSLALFAWESIKPHVLGGTIARCNPELPPRGHRMNSVMLFEPPSLFQFLVLAPPPDVLDVPGHCCWDRAASSTA